MDKSRTLANWMVCAALPLLVSCSGTPVLQGTLPEVPDRQRVTLMPGDEVELKFHYWPELNETQVVRPDGMISLQLVDDIEAAGLTPQELDARLTALYESKIKEPEITVIVRTLASNFVYVGGEVKEPGKIPIEGGLDLMQALVTAGGFVNLSADPTNVIVYREGGGKRHATSFNVEDLIASEEAPKVALGPNDIVYVTRSGIDEANQWVLQHIDNMIPRNVTVPASVVAAEAIRD